MSVRTAFRPAFRPTVRSVALLGALAALCSVGQAAFAQAYPSKPVRVVIGFPPGTPPEVVGRMVSDKMAATMGQPFVVENRPGASGTISANLVAQAEPDGYTLMVGVAANLAVAPHLLPSAKYDPSKVFTPIGQIQRGPYFVFVRSDLPVNTVPELVAYAKANPGKLNFGTPGLATLHHLTWELLMQRTGTSLVHVPFQGGAQVVTEAMAGRIQTFMENASGAVMAQVRSGAFRAIGMTGAQRAAQLPNVPTTAEQNLAGIESYSWWGMVGPANLPRPIVTQLNTALNRALTAPDLAERLRGEGVPDNLRVTSTPEEFGAWVASEYERWGKVIREAKITIQ